MNIKTALIIFIISLLFIVWLLGFYKKAGAGYQHYCRYNCITPTEASPSATLSPTIEITPFEEPTPTATDSPTLADNPQKGGDSPQPNNPNDGRSDGGRSSDFEAKQQYSAYDGSPVIAK
jgi:hypothetical protein